VEAARNSIFREISNVLEVASSINSRHKAMLADRMANTAELVSISRTGVNRDRGNPIGKASFEETTDMFIQAAKTGEVDLVRGPSANVMLGQPGFYGTSSFDIVLDLERLQHGAAQRKRYAAPPDVPETNRVDLPNLELKNDLAALLRTETEPEQNDYSIDL
jgi:DNA-directed RNA polymerase beta' subunit